MTSAILVFTYSGNTSTSSADAAVILGAGVWEGRPSPVFEERIRHGVNLYNSGQVRALIFTGGVGEDDDIAESEAGREFAIEQGVPEKDIYIETASHITVENLQEAKAIIDREGFKQVLIVSDPLHMKRAMTMARDVGLDALPSPTPTTRYRSFRAKAGFLMHEAWFYLTYKIGRLIG